jgi:hypothetical protein
MSPVNGDQYNQYKINHLQGIQIPGFQSQIAKKKFRIKIGLKYQYLDIPETRFYVAKTAVIHRFASLLAAAKTVRFLSFVLIPLLWKRISVSDLHQDTNGSRIRIGNPDPGKPKLCPPPPPQKKGKD